VFKDKQVVELFNLNVDEGSIIATQKPIKSKLWKHWELKNQWKLRKQGKQRKSTKGSKLRKLRQPYLIKMKMLFTVRGLKDRCNVHPTILPIATKTQKLSSGYGVVQST
jgi:hypothetical protein